MTYANVAMPFFDYLDNIKYLNTLQMAGTIHLSHYLILSFYLKLKFSILFFLLKNQNNKINII